MQIPSQTIVGLIENVATLNEQYKTVAAATEEIKEKIDTLRDDSQRRHEDFIEAVNTKLDSNSNFLQKETLDRYAQHQENGARLANLEKAMEVNKAWLAGVCATVAATATLLTFLLNQLPNLWQLIHPAH